MSGNPSIVFPQAGSTAIEDRSIPEPKADQLLMRTAFSLISTGTEMMVRSARGKAGTVWAEMSQFPYYPGYCSSGEVIAVGADVDDSWVGRRVVSLMSHAAYSTPTLNLVRPIPDGVALEDAAFSPLAEIAMNGLRRARFTWGESVAIVGLGVLGQLTARICAFAGASRIFAVDRAEPRLSGFPQTPGAHAFAGEAAEFTDAIRKLNHDRRVDVVFELTGNPEAIAGQLALLRPQGRFVILSSPSGETRFDFHDLCNRPSFTILGAHYFSYPPVETPDNPWTGQRHGEIFLEALAHDRLEVADLITHRFAYPQAPDAYELLATRRAEAVGVLIDWQA